MSTVGKFKLDTVPWVIVDGAPVYTNQVIEEALGLSPLICGWGKRGFYVATYRGQTTAAVKAQLRKIDWKRVAAVKQEFDIKMSGSGCMVVNSQRVRFVTEKRFQRLMRNCMKDVPAAKFDHEREVARRRAPRLDYASGNL